MDRKIISLMLAIFLIGIGIVTAGILDYNTKDKEIPKGDKSVLDRAGLTDYTLSEISCNSEYCKPLVFKKEGVVETSFNIKPYYEVCGDLKEVFNKELEVDETICLEMDKVYYTNLELEKQRESFENDVLSRVLKRQIIREDNGIYDKKAEGEVVTTKEKK